MLPDVAARKPASGVTHAEIKAGVFLTFCLALFVAMLFVLGKFGHIWRGRQEVQVVFSQVCALRPQAPVHYNGMDVGLVKNVRILQADTDLIEHLPTLTRDSLVNLPLTSLEREKLKELPAATLDAETRKLLPGRTMVLLTLDLVCEKDAERFRVDDEYLISGSLMGDSSVEIRTGAGVGVPPNHNKYFLGVSGDMYTDLGKSISQVKDILGSMSEMVGGDDNGLQIQGQLANFDAFTLRMEDMSKSREEKLPSIWDGIDQSINDGGKKLDEIEAKVAGMKPGLDQTLDNAQKAIAEMHKNAAQSVVEMHARVKQYSLDSKESLKALGEAASKMKDSLPDQIASLREWSEKFPPTVEKLDAFLARADDQLNKGIENTRASLQQYITMAGNLEETTYRLWHWPWSFARPPSEQQAQAQDAMWRADLARRQYRELRAEMARAQQDLQNIKANDKPRAARFAELLNELDADLEVSRDGKPAPSAPAATPAKPPKKGGK
jgi:hypothetical protein